MTHRLVPWWLLASAACAPLPEPPAVTVGGATVRGARFDSGGGAVFRGIPYAQAPVGSARFRPPRPVELAATSLDVTSFPPACIQPRGEAGNISWYWEVAEGFGQPRDVVLDEPRFDEDCLYLNVWSPDRQPGADDGAPLPVMVWIHGGSNHTGWSFEPPYVGETLARRGVVVVSINYRLGELGFLAHPDLTAESATRSSGNYGLLDQIAALEWVQRHIAAFGGDPDRVTIFGESAGAADVGYLLVSPLADGLFHRAISQSGGYQIADIRDLDSEERIGRRIAATADDLRRMSAQEILDRAAELGVTGRYGPNIDGWALPAPPRERHAQSGSRRVPVLIGTNANEYSMWLPDDIGAPGIAEDIEKDYGAMAPRALELYRELGFDRFYTNDVFACPSIHIARLTSYQGSPTFVYEFTRSLPDSGALGAFHGGEIPYVFGTPEPWHGWEKTDEDLSEAMMTYWVRFATTGDPNGEGLPPWPAFDGEERYLELGSRIRARDGLQPESCRLFDAKLLEPYA